MILSIFIAGASKAESSSTKEPPFLSLVVTILSFAPLFAQSPPASPNRPRHSPEERILAEEGQRYRQNAFLPPSGKTWSQAELVDFAESHNPETRVSWQNAIVRGEALGIARSELFPLLSAVVMSGVERGEVPFGTRFYRFTIPTVQASVDLSYAIFNFGGRRGRIDAEGARLLAANFAFNDVHRNLIFQVQQAYYRLLNASGQEAAARASLDNSEQVQQAAEARLQNGLATLPDVLEARSATAQAQYDLQAVLGEEQIVRGDLASALGLPAATMIPIQPLDEIPTPESISETVEQVIERALPQRPDLQAEAANVRAANAERQEARSAFYPDLKFQGEATAESLYVQQQNLPWGHTADLTGRLALDPELDGI